MLSKKSNTEKPQRDINGYCQHDQRLGVLGFFTGMTFIGLLMIAYLQSWSMRDVGKASFKIIPITLFLSWLLYANSVSISEYKRAGETTAQTEEG